MKILIVEDEHKIADSLKQGLEQEGYTCDTAYNGIEGYDLAASENHDLIILDLMLPQMNGMEICQKLRKQGKNTPILMVTARSKLDDKVKGLDCGADDYLTKPFAFEELLARTKALLRRPEKVVPEVSYCDSLVLNTNTFEVTRNGINIELSKKEFALLAYLMRNKNKIVSKEKIIEQVWDFEADILPNTVEVYIGYLRNKIEKPFKKLPKLIKTVRGFGYKIVEPK